MKQSKTLAECMQDLHDTWAALFYVSYGVLYGYYVRYILWYRRNITGRPKYYK